MGRGLGMALAGAAQGFGEGLQEQAEARRKQALMALREKYRQQDRQQDRQWDVEDRELKHERRQDELETRHDQRMKEIGARKARRGGGGGGGGAEDWHKVKLPASVDLSITKALEERYGLPPDDLTVDAVKDEVKKGVAEGMDPNAAVDDALGRMIDLEREETTGSGWFDGPERTETVTEGFSGRFRSRGGGGSGNGLGVGAADEAPSRAPAAPGGDLKPIPPAIAAEARNAVRAGADPAAVAKRLRENGYDPMTIQEDLKQVTR